MEKMGETAEDCLSKFKTNIFNEGINKELKRNYDNFHRLYR